MGTFIIADIFIDINPINSEKNSLKSLQVVSYMKTIFGMTES